MRSTHRLTLTFHGLGEPPSHIPPDEVDYWVPVGLFVEILDRFAHLPHVQLTFDDGNASDFELALPELAKRSICAEFFVLAGRMDQLGYLGPPEIRELVDSGMRVGLHGMDHRSWADCDGAELETEICEARRQIESVAGHPVNRAACPFGAYDARCLRRLENSGFERVYTSDGGVARADDWLHCRNTVQGSHGFEYIRALVEQPPLGLRDLHRRLKTFLKSKRGALYS